MAIDLKDIIENIKDIQMTDSSLNILMDFERVLDGVDLYSFKNWKMGELVEGPINKKYFVTCTFMWPKKLMPDPRGAERLLNYDCEIKYRKSTLSKSKDIETPDDYRPGTKFAKRIEIPIWLVEITIPKHFMSTISLGSIEVEGKDVDLTDIDEAYDDGEDNEAEQGTQGQQPGVAQPGAAVAPTI